MVLPTLLARNARVEWAKQQYEAKRLRSGNYLILPSQNLQIAQACRSAFLSRLSRTMLLNQVKQYLGVYSQMAKIDDEQFLSVSAPSLFYELSDTQLENDCGSGNLEPNLDIRQLLEKQPGIQTASEKPISKDFPLPLLKQTKIVSQQRSPVFRRCGGLSEY